MLSFESRAASLLIMLMAPACADRERIEPSRTHLLEQPPSPSPPGPCFQLQFGAWKPPLEYLHVVFATPPEFVYLSDSVIPVEDSEINVSSLYVLRDTGGRWERTGFWERTGPGPLRIYFGGGYGIRLVFPDTAHVVRGYAEAFSEGSHPPMPQPQTVVHATRVTCPAES